MSNDENYFFGKDEIENNANVEELKKWLSARTAESEVDEHMRVLPVNRQDPTGMKLHMINSHQFSIDNTTWANEEPHDAIPRIRHKMRMMQGDDHYPKLDHEDVLAWHDHEHTAGDSADEHPFENVGDEHKHL